MKRIFFENHQDQEYNTISSILIVLAILVGLVKPLSVIPDAIYALLFIGSILYSIMTLNFLRYRNHVYYSNGKITIHLNSFFGQTIKFNKIKTYSFDSDYLNIEFKGGSLTYFSLKNIDPQDIDYLKKIFISNFANSDDS